MPKTQTPEELRQQAAELSQKAAEAQAAVDKLTVEEYEREQQALAERDRQLVADFDREALERDLEEARAKYTQALAESPVVQALADLIAAGYRRSWAFADLTSARSRLGMPAAATPGPAYVEPLADAMANAAQRIAQERIDLERAQA